MLDFTGLEAAVSKETAGVDSVIALLQSIKAQLATELAGQPAAQAKVNALMDELIASGGKIDAALATNPGP